LVTETVQEVILYFSQYVVHRQTMLTNLQPNRFQYNYPLSDFLFVTGQLCTPCLKSCRKKLLPV